MPHVAVVLVVLVGFVGNGFAYLANTDVDVDVAVFVVVAITFTAAAGLDLLVLQPFATMLLLPTYIHRYLLQTQIENL